MNEIFRLMKRNRKRAARILAQRLKNRTHPPQGPKAAKELEKERLVVLEEISKGQDSPTSVIYNYLCKLIHTPDAPNHPYFRPVIGSNKVIETISREEILDFYRRLREILIDKQYKIIYLDVEDIAFDFQ